MLTINDCIALSDLTEKEIDAIAEHEHLPEMVAIELGCCLVHCDGGARRIASFICDDIERARLHGNARHAADLTAVLRDFVAHHKMESGLRNPVG
ncbi:MAG TPA: hypothetical protein VD978_15795 [Azospirillum sp.]|nr:hypothetical protein [Azospirillum sp.]